MSIHSSSLWLLPWAASPCSHTRLCVAFENKTPLLDPSLPVAAVAWYRFLPVLWLWSQPHPHLGWGDIQAELALLMIFIPKEKWGQRVTSDFVRSWENSTGERLKSQLLTCDLTGL